MHVHCCCMVTSALCIFWPKGIMGLLEKRNFYFGKKQTHENCSWCQDLTVTIFAGTPFVQELLFEILYAGQSRNISKFGTHLSLIYHLSFRKIRLESKWNTPFWIVPAEDFREKQNIRKVSPAFPDGMFQTEIRVDASFKYIFRARFSVNGTDLSRFVHQW